MTAHDAARDFLAGHQDALLLVVWGGLAILALAALAWGGWVGVRRFLDWREDVAYRLRRVTMDEARQAVTREYEDRLRAAAGDIQEARQAVLAAEAERDRARQDVEDARQAAERAADDSLRLEAKALEIARDAGRQVPDLEKQLERVKAERNALRGDVKRAHDATRAADEQYQQTRKELLQITECEHEKLKPVHIRQADPNDGASYVQVGDYCLDCWRVLGEPDNDAGADQPLTNPEQET